MMSLREEIEKDMVAAMKSGEEIKKTTLRMLKADIMTEKARTGNDPSEEVVLELVMRAAKRRKEAFEEFIKAGRDDLAKTEKDELEIIEKYLPKQLTEEEVSAEIDKKIASIGTFTQKEMGKVMGELMKELKGRVDGTIVKKILSGKIEGNQA
jgi:uncharacterized protein YqeY